MWSLGESEEDPDEDAQYNSYNDIQPHGEKGDLLPHFPPDYGHSGQAGNKKAHKYCKHDELLFGDDRHQIVVVNTQSLEHHDEREFLAQKSENKSYP